MLTMDEAKFMSFQCSVANLGALNAGWLFLISTYVEEILESCFARLRIPENAFSLSIQKEEEKGKKEDVSISEC